uniref:Ribosomal protein S11 n=1 Tax=Rhodymenia pseudopalmata TaxID=31502 RepID=V9NFF6_RHOPU|nr:ribosomal protein S11 [Rhodymenia pseudopalmata]AGO19269.1 ribosomal protein S11 [Rhodymenia pseudopalmata]
MKLFKSLILSILFTSNNILYTITDLEGNVVYWTSIGAYKTKGAKKITSTSLISVTKLVAAYLQKLNCRFLHVKLKGFRKNKKTILKYIKAKDLNILSICDKNSLPHNGCKEQKTRRL